MQPAGWTPLHFAALKGHFKIVEYLLADTRAQIDVLTSVSCSDYVDEFVAVLLCDQ